MITPFDRRDRVCGTGFGYACRIGLHDYERCIRQRVTIDFEALTDWRADARADATRASVDYFEINRLIGEMIEGGTWNLLEALAEDIARLICTSFPVSGVRVRVNKGPFDMPNAKGVAVECWREASDFKEREPSA